MKPYLLLAALVLAGCTTIDAPEMPSAATAAPSNSVQFPSPKPETDFDRALRYTRCMSELGFKMSDPVIGEPLPVTPRISRDEITSRSQDDFIDRRTKFKEAFTKCKPFLPATWPVKEDPAQLAKERAFKECLNKRGIQTYDADANGMVHYPTDLSYLEDPKYRAAESACRHLYDDPANKGGS